MRFTIWQLMLFPVVFLFNSWLVSVFVVSVLGSFPWQRETNGVMHAQDWIESSVRYCKLAGVLVTDQTLNDWLGRRLSSGHPAASILVDPPRPDAWGNPYRIQPRDAFDEEPRVCSTGKDGLSKSDGNDPDDIRSWDEKRGRWYTRQQFNHVVSFCMIASALITVAGFWLFTYNPVHRSGSR